MQTVSFALLLTAATVLSDSGPPTRGPSTPHRCEGAMEPDLSKLAGSDTLQETFYRMEPVWSSLGFRPDVPEEFVDVQLSYLHGHRMCPSWGVAAHRYGGALCPSYSVLNYDQHRLPRTLVEARCSCTSCRRHPDDQGVPSRRSVLECRPVLHYVPVHRRVGCSQGVYQYRQVWEPLTVACTCSAPSLQMS